MPHNDVQGKTLLIVNTGPEKKRFILEILKKLGLRLVMLHHKKNWADSLVDEWIISDVTDEQKSVSSVKNFLAKHPKIKIDGAMTYRDGSVLLTSRLIEEFNWVGIPYSATSHVRNKSDFRSFCRENDLPSPNHFLINTRDDINKIPKSVTFPVVIKPVFGCMSAFVVKVDSKDALFTTYDYIRENLPYYAEADEMESLEKILVEEYIDGDEVDIDIVLQNGKVKFHSISDNYSAHEPFFIETGQCIPSNLPPSDQYSLIDMAEQVMEQIGVMNGIIHFEAKMTKTGPVPIEINLRMGGDEVYSFVKGAWVVDLVENAAKIALGVYIPRIKRNENPKTFIAGAYFLSDESGIIVKRTVNKDVYKSPSLGELHCLKKVGDVILAPPEGFEYLGWITATGVNPINAEDNLKKLSNMVHYEVAKFDPSSSMGKTKRTHNFTSAYITKTLLKGAARVATINRLMATSPKKLALGVLANIYDSTNDPIEQHLDATGRLVTETLQKSGYSTKLFNLNILQASFDEFQKNGIDFVFNVAKRIHNSDRMESHVAALCEILQLPYSGSNLMTLALCADKIRAKKLLAYHHIPTAKWDYATSPDDKISSKLQYPLIVKPSNTDRSSGVTNNSVVTNERELRRELSTIITGLGRQALIEEYIEGDEYDVSIIGNGDKLEILPLTRSIFKDSKDSNEWAIYSYEKKWSAEKKNANVEIQRPANIEDPKLASLLTEIGVDVYRIFECQDYARIEIKVDREGNPHVLECNANPSLYNDSFFAQAALSTKITYSDLIEKIISVAIQRYRHIG